MRLSLRALAALLSYPTEDLVAALPELRAALRDDLALAPAQPGLDALLQHMAACDLLDLQEQHVTMFDRGRNLCLNLFEHVHGDSRERGPAMVELQRFYTEAGLEPTSGELPDYLPMLLEYAAVAPEAGVNLLGNAAPVLNLLHGRMLAREVPHAAVLHAALLAAGQRPLAEPVTPEPEQTAEELDAAWAEAPVIFGPGADPAADCGIAALGPKLRAATRTSNPPPSRRPEIRRVAASHG